MAHSTIVSELIAEERRLLLKLEKVRELRALYVSDVTDITREVVQRQPSSSKIADDDVVLGASADLIMGRTRPTPTREILDHLQRKGIQVGGKEPRNNLSSKFSHSPRFIAHGRSGWTLADEQAATGDMEHEAPDDTSEAHRPSEASSGAGVGHSENLWNGGNAPER